MPRLESDEDRVRQIPTLDQAIAALRRGAEDGYKLDPPDYSTDYTGMERMMYLSGHEIGRKNRITDDELAQKEDEGKN